MMTDHVADTAVKRRLAVALFELEGRPDPEFPVNIPNWDNSLTDAEFIIKWLDENGFDISILSKGK